MAEEGAVGVDVTAVWETTDYIVIPVGRECGLGDDGGGMDARKRRTCHEPNGRAQRDPRLVDPYPWCTASG